MATNKTLLTNRDFSSEQFNHVPISQIIAKVKESGCLANQTVHSFRYKILLDVKYKLLSNGRQGFMCSLLDGIWRSL